jgi:hypothetical protein
MTTAMTGLQASAALPRGFCKHWDSVFIKASGRIPCGCDHGENYTLADADMEKVDFVPEVLNGPVFRQMRIKMVIENRAFIEECRPCAFFKPLEPEFDTTGRNPRFPALTDADQSAAGQLRDVHARRGWPLGSIDRISSLHLEPSLPCTLRCPGCKQGFDPDLLRREGLPYYFSPTVVENIARSCVKHDVSVRRVGFGGRGEPTLSPHTPDIIRTCRKAFPTAILESDSNAQHAFKDEFLLLDLMQCSIDGSTPESYATYRIGGNFENAISFLRTATARKRELKARTQFVWKYILFDTTESVELMNNAQRMALDIGVDSLLFIITWMAGTNGKVFPAKKMTTVEAVNAYLKANPIFPRCRVTYMM